MKTSKKQEKNLLNNLEIMHKLTDKQRKYVISLMLKGIYDICPKKLAEIRE